MFQIPQRQYWSCMGETVLKDSKFREDSAASKAFNRGFADTQALQTTQLQQRYSLPTLNFGQENQPQAPQPPLVRFIQAVVQLISPPVQLLQNALQNFAQNLSQLLAGQNNKQAVPGFMEKAASQILSFFFGNRKDLRDSKDEKEQRDSNEIPMLDVFGASKVEKKDNAGFGANG